MQKVVHDAKCDICESYPIIGIRYKCAVCEDYDVCENCELKLIHNHPFIKIRYLYQTP